MDLSSIPLTEELDHEILMHRDVHFSGSFPDMLEYYENEGKGVQDDFEPIRIYQLAQIEQELGHSLSEELLQDRELNLIEKAKEKYLLLRDLYECETASPLSIAIADLILSEEESPDKEIDTLVAFGSEAIDQLLELIRSEEFANPLFPGYGMAPLYAAEILAKIGDEKAIVPLFEGAKGYGFEREGMFFSALSRLPSTEFLLRKLTSLPITNDHQIAADALAHFPPTEEIAKAALDLLFQEETQKEPALTFALILLCEGLSNDADRERFASLKQSESIPSSLKEEIERTLSIQ